MEKQTQKTGQQRGWGAEAAVFLLPAQLLKKKDHRKPQVSPVKVSRKTLPVWLRGKRTIQRLIVS